MRILSHFLRLLPLLAVIAILPAAGPSIGHHPSSAIASSTPLQGDVTCDATVDLSDDQQLLRSAAGLQTDAGCLHNAGDVDCSGSVDAADGLRVLRYLAGVPAETAAGCSPIGEPVVVQAMSADKIAAALNAGNIDFETSLLYRAYALFNDPKLPEAYRSPIPDLDDAVDLFKQVELHHDSLSADTLDALAPYMARPNDPASFYNQPHGTSAQAAGEWRSLSILGGSYRLWTFGEQAAADATLNEYEADVREIVPELDKIIDAPIPDTPGIPNFDLNPDNAIDIFLVDPGGFDPRYQNCAVQGGLTCFLPGLGLTRDSEPFIGNKSSAWVLVDKEFSGATRTEILAHELFHASQNSYDYQETGDGVWFADSTAEWGAFQVLKQLDKDRTTVHGMLHQFFAELESKHLTNPDDFHRYASWIYYYFLSLKEGTTDVTRHIWEAAAAPGPQLSSAIDQVYPFDEYFPEFAAYNWNQPPDDYYILDDQIVDTAPLYYHDPEEVTLNGSPAARKFYTAGSVDWLTAHYFDYQFTDPAVRSATFHNTLVDDDNAHITALIKVNGDWREEDWSDEKTIFLCRDKASQHYDEVVVIISNSDFSTQQTLHPAGDEDPYLEASAVGCPGYSGSVSAETYLNGATFSITLDNVYFTHDPGDTDPNDNLESYVFKSSDPIVWHASGHWPRADCMITGEMALDQPGSGGPHEAYGGIQITRNTGEYNIDIAGQNDDPGLVTVSCQGDQPYTAPWPVVRPITWDGNTTPSTIEDHNGTKVLDGDYSNPDQFTGGAWTWHLEEVK